MFEECVDFGVIGGNSRLVYKGCASAMLFVNLLHVFSGLGPQVPNWCLEVGMYWNVDFKSLGGFEKILEFEEIWVKSQNDGWDLKKGK